MKETKRLEKEAKELEKETKKLEKEAKKLDKARGITIDELSDDDDELSNDDDELSNDDDELSDDAHDALIGGAGEGENPFEEFINVQNDDTRVTLTNYKDQDAMDREIYELEGDELLETMGDSIYRDEIRKSMNYLREHKQSLLSLDSLQTYSPKFLAMIENIQDPEHPGLHLVYSQFRTMEGIGIFSIALEANGFAQFKIKRSGASGWEFDMSEEDLGKPCYALYTGTEDADEREIIRNIYNGTWDAIPNNIAAQLKAKSSNNNMGEIITILMITSAGSEGINLRNTRYVHIMEPYWHPVRTEQVIGRARRICSHQSLPTELQTVEVFIYIMTFTKKQLDSEYATELKIKDTSKLAPYLPQSSDEKLYEISNIKEQLTSQLLTGIKESAIDCATHSKSTSKEGLTCLSFGRPDITDFAFNPNYAQDENDVVATINKVAKNWKAQEINVSGKKYALKVGTNDVYDYDSVIQSRQHAGVMAIYLGKLEKTVNGDYIIKKDTL